MISERELKELQEIVGAQWVSAAPCMMDTYSFYMNPETLVKDGGRWTPRPVAVVMPENTEEIQKIVRLCNKTNLMTKPLSTGFHCVAAASRDRVVVLDLKRMNRIIDIDAKNQIAVIEPYVKAIDLQTELFKHGLNVHIISCGGNHSVLASTAAAWGYGVSGSSTSYSGRNLLGVEWVLPTGDLLTLGSGGIGANWFTADGPGPSLRGIMRGFQGTFGSLGVFTKCAVKLYKWDGPAEWEVQGKSPVYYLDRIPARMAMNVLAFPSSQAMKDAGYKLGEAEIDYAQFRTPMFFSALGMTDNNEELKIALESGVFQKTMAHTLVNAIVGYSDGEFRWKMDALKQILKETDGVMVPMNFKVNADSLRRVQGLIKHMDDPLALLRRLPFLQDLIRKVPIGKQQRLIRESLLFWLLIRNAVNTQSTFRPSQGMGTAVGAFDTWDLGIAQSEWFAEKKREYIEKGLILDDGGDNGCGGTFESGHLGYLEGIFMYDPKNPDSIMASGELVDIGAQGSIDNALGVPIAAFGCEMNARFGPECSNYLRWMSKIKRALDPNTAFDPFFYAESEEGE